MSTRREMARQKLELDRIRPYFKLWKEKVEINSEIMRREADNFRYKQLLQRL